MDLENPQNKQIRLFGVALFIFFGMLAFLHFWLRKSLPVFLFGTFSFLGLGFVLIPYRLRFIYTGWLRIAHLLGRIVTTLVLSLAFYLVITPAAFIKRLFGGNPLPVKPDKKASSYWVPRSEPAQPRERFLKRY